MNMEKYLDFLNEMKKLVGLSDWKILISTEPIPEIEFAQVESDIYEKTLKVALGTDFVKLPEERQRNILLHELLHGRLDILYCNMRKTIDFLEEDFINDITRGFERHGELKWKEEYMSQAPIQETKKKTQKEQKTVEKV